MIKIEKKHNCCGCHACYNVCPKNAIKMLEDNKGFKYPEVDKEKCIDCGLCDKSCPMNDNKNNSEEIPKAYACLNKSEDIRLKSSSGGIFTLLANWILKKNGVVFGAAFDDQFQLRHSYIESEEDIKVFRGSKYLQSTIGDSYSKVREFLNNDRYVLFTGTPCQVEGLKTYLGKEYDKLYTQDIICHGVPSPKVWKKYKLYREDIENSSLRYMNFRNKNNGWKNYNTNMTFANNKEYMKDHSKDIYSRAFLNNIDLRDSCYSCKFKKNSRVSDITLADFWGIGNVCKAMDDGKGTSLVMVHSDKGQKLMDSININIIKEEVVFSEAIKYNKSMNTPSKINKNRDKFFKELDILPFEQLVNKYVPEPSTLTKILKKSKRLVKKVLKKQ